jgi:hypothetical protein
MPALTLAPHERRCCERAARGAEPRPPGFTWVAWSALALLAGYLLFCHGCHGDEDNELLAQTSAVHSAHENAHGR